MAVTHPSSPQFPAIVSTFGYSPLLPATWHRDAATGLQSRDLSLDFASEGALTARHLRVAGTPISTSALGDPASPFVFLFVLAGSLSMQGAGAASLTLRRYGCVYRYGTGQPAQWHLSDDAEIIEIRGAPRASVVLGLQDLQAGAWASRIDKAADYIVGDGPRSFFSYRDLGVAAVTGRRIHIHVVRSSKPIEKGTGWHSHSMGQLFYVLEGWAELEVERLPSVRMSAGDAMCISPRLKHDVSMFSNDYAVLEMCIPADYDTVDA
jgi:mannose-6-phosphate isomerase-like protein (cupin superfamily)